MVESQEREREREREEEGGIELTTELEEANKNHERHLRMPVGRWKLDLNVQLSHELGSEQASEQAQQSAGPKQAVWSKVVGERSEWTGERVAQYQCLNFERFWITVSAETEDGTLNWQGWKKKQARVLFSTRPGGWQNQSCSDTNLPKQFWKFR